MDFRPDRRSDELEKILTKFADRIEKLETVLDYWPPDENKNGLSLTTVLSVVGAVLLGLIAFMGSGALNRLDMVFHENTKVVGQVDRISWWLGELQKRHDALEKEVRDLRDRK